MHKQWRLILDLLWPAKEAPSIATHNMHPTLYQGSVFLFAYHDQHIQQLIRSNKYHGNRPAAKQLARYVDAYLRSYSGQDLTIVPIPSSRRRWRDRGYFHLRTILKYSAHHKNVRADLMYKHRHTAPQTQVTKQQRLQQQAGTFRCDTKQVQALTGTVVLFDDVLTTGATMAAARATLAPHLSPGVTLICLALAH